MSIDGTYGRFSAHNQRFKELRRKQLERREQRLLLTSMIDVYGDDSKPDIESIDSKKLEIIKVEIRKKAKKQLRKESYISIVCFILTFFIMRFLNFI